jgi:hypothetical protein
MVAEGVGGINERIVHFLALDCPVRLCNADQ